jgi:hypothetical protein
MEIMQKLFILVRRKANQKVYAIKIIKKKK